MLKKLSSVLLAALLCLSLAGCASAFEKEYLSVAEYVPANQNEEDSGERVKVRNYSSLKQAIRLLALSGEAEGNIIFDTAYDGDIVDDVARACWELRTEDAFCTYCVDNISYEVSTIVSYEEATVFISYSRPDIKSIVSLQYMSGADETILDAFRNGKNKLVLLVNRSNYTADDVENIVARIYRGNPASAPRMPDIEVKLFSGTGLQKLYEINLNYGMPPSELHQRQEELNGFAPFEKTDITALSETERVYIACCYIMENCRYNDEGGTNNIYSALIRNTADSEGMAYGFVELCRQLGVECQLIYGQRNWQDHCWNIVRVNGEYFHIDVSICATSGMDGSFMLKDSEIWENYRWDVSAYPECTGQIFTSEELNILRGNERIN